MTIFGEPLQQENQHGGFKKENALPWFAGLGKKKNGPRDLHSIPRSDTFANPRLKQHMQLEPAWALPPKSLKREKHSGFPLIRKLE